MLLHCCYTPAHEVLFRQVFRPSVPEGFDVKAYRIAIDGPGDYLSGEFLRCIRAKLDLVIESVSANPGQTIVWSDVDIRFMSASPEELRGLIQSSGCDILFQRESRRIQDVNTGFFVCHCCDGILDFFKAVRKELDTHPAENEQMVVNRLLFGKCEMRNVECGKETPASATRNTELSWGYLPLRYYARTHGWPPPIKPSIYHANYTKGRDAIGQKLIQFDEVERLVRGGWSGRALSIIRHALRRIFVA